MNRTRTLLVIGVFMFSLAVLAALEFRVQETVPTEGQMVTGSLSKNVPSLPTLPGSTPEQEKGGVLVPLDSGTLRGGSGSSLDMTTPATPSGASASAPETSTPTDPMSPAETAAAPQTVSEDPDSLSAPAVPEEAPVVAEKKTEKPSEKKADKPVSTPAPAPEKKSGLVLTTKAPAKLAAGQTAITATRLEVGKDIVFRATGAAPIARVKTLLLKDPDRYVVDLQGSWGIQIPKLPDDLWIKNIRVGQREDATRLVFELNRTPKSATASKVNASTVEVRIK